LSEAGSARQQKVKAATVAARPIVSLVPRSGGALRGLQWRLSSGAPANRHQKQERIQWV